MLSIGIDIGGTKVLGGLVTEHGDILLTRRLPTPGNSAADVESAICTLVNELEVLAPTSSKATAIGIGAAGWIDSAGQTVLFSPHLAWRNVPLRQRLEDRLGRSVTLANDANAAAWAEVRYGAAADVSRSICLTLGTGIGGAIVNSGHLDVGAYGLAGEFGHQVINPGGRRCECGNRGCWEQYASGNALGTEARELARANSPVAAALLERVDGDVDSLTGLIVTELAAAGDPACRELVEEVGMWLGAGLANLAAALDPELFVIGGGLSDAGELLLAPARTSFARNLPGRGFRPMAHIVSAKRGSMAGLVGAADLARQALRTETP